MTGLSYYYEAITAKKVELLKEFVPQLARVGVLRNPLNPGRPTWKETEVAAQRLGVALEALEVRRPEDFEAAFATFKERNAQALFPLGDGLTDPAFDLYNKYRAAAQNALEHATHSRLIEFNQLPCSSADWPAQFLD